ncbi:hypothetical protein C9J03_02410 [Photobacterium gaetbulicola]|uniref:Putative glycosyl transferase family 2 n=1 Tax=Photobacterium gaetbulicola Gung47 TaxID=658445 RepID=A0A0C5WSX0_9GAMM|nr:glycosyltransferase [Photobacterium gaetbulicola]AJR09502.1 putative glycosyl transferase family 2 [Photobacterium gaetbulicola Gung47]PSU14296.1 hypothetical protein C9J03_02410 [Photobacterium gaetbulicola]
MKLSVVIPLYNKEKYIKRCVDSVIEQSYQDFEIIVIDDGSTDSSIDVLNGISDSRLNIVKKENGGVSSARNKGIDLSNSEYVCFLDADDYWRKNVLCEFVRLIDCYEECSAFVVSSTFNLDNCDHNREINDYVIDDYYEQLSKDNVIINSSSICIKKEIFSKIGKFPNDIHYGEDGYLWAKIYNSFKIAKSSYVGAIYDKQAVGRCADIYNPKLEHPLVIAFDKGERFSSEPEYESYINSLRFSFAKKWLLHGEKYKYKKTIERVKFNTLFKSLFYRLIIYIPTPVLKILYLKLRA